ncbi:Hypothetical protein BN2458_PEG1958 [Helicobacter typhlonius]|uniref:Uncharacterized protein n=1 Tax=Helicobacter typhlonius TaxID=76936 RepID=A0A0S4PX29_9HELI|nr:Hypothetical protein BN2458_PEG1958 [Helicobacter typhlonius]
MCICEYHKKYPLFHRVPFVLKCRDSSAKTSTKVRCAKA